MMKTTFSAALAMLMMVASAGAQTRTFPQREVEAFCEARFGRIGSDAIRCETRERDAFDRYRGLWEPRAGFQDVLAAPYIHCESTERPYWDSVHLCAEQQLAAWIRLRTNYQAALARGRTQDQVVNLMALCAYRLNVQISNMADVRPLESCLRRELGRLQ